MADAFWQHLRAAARGLRGTPGVSMAIVFTLALGIGVNAMMFGVIDRLLLSPPQHLAQADRLRHVYLERAGSDGLRSLSRLLTYPDLRGVQPLSAFASVGAYDAAVRTWTMGAGVEARRVRVQQADAAFFPTLGVHPARGRFYGREDDTPGAPLTAVISDEYWERQFGRDPDVIGRVLTLNRGRYEVIGIAPSGFTGAELGAVDVWLPLTASAFAEAGPNAGFDDRGMSWIRIVARLADDVTSEAADAQATTAYVAALRAYEQERGPAYLASRHHVLVDAAKPRVFTASVIASRGPSPTRMSAISRWLGGVSLIVLLIACANVANLLLARGIRARRELAIRVALGADRRRLLIQSLTEAGLLSAAGAAAALAVAWWSSGIVHAFLVPDVAFTDTGMTRRLILFLLGATVMTTALAGLLPAVQASRVASTDALRAASRGNASARSRLRDALMIGQIALSFVLLVGAGLFVRSLWSAVNTDVGFDYERTLSVSIEDAIDAGAGRQAVQRRRTELYREALARVSTLPGVRSAALAAATTPLAGLDRFTPQELRVPGVDALPQLPGGGPYRYSGTEAFFTTLGLQVTRGRAFEHGEFQDGGEPVIMVNETFARTLWPTRDPLAQCVTYVEPKPPSTNMPSTNTPSTNTGPQARPAPCRRVVGVFKDIARLGLADRPALQLAYPALPDTYIKRLIVRAEGDPVSLIPSIRRAVLGVSSDIRFVEVRTNAAAFETLLGPWRLGSIMFTAFGVLALLVAVVGLYSLLAFGVAQRRRELGIRAALGARRAHQIRLVAGQAAAIVVTGLVLGTLMALAAGRLINGILFGVTATHFPVYGLVLLTLIAAGTVAGLVPAWRATAIAPSTAMDSE